MSDRTIDAIVLGAGMVGVSAALHLQSRGLDVALVDRRVGAGQETSYGNAGLIEAATVFPHMFPRDTRKLLSYALNRAPEAYYHLKALPRIFPWLVQYYLSSSPSRALQTAMAALPLIRRSLDEHKALIGQAGVSELIRHTGWIKLFRSPRALADALTAFERDKQYGVSGEILEPAQISRLEPRLLGQFAGAIHWTDPAFIPDPGALAKAYANLFLGKGGRFISADARALEPSGRKWRLPFAGGTLIAEHAVIALGPWSDEVFKPQGYIIPLMVKRGYHLHFQRTTETNLERPVLDAENGYLLAPMNRGVRLTTGAEFAHRDSKPTPVQLARVLPLAKAMLPLGPQIEPKPWVGSRPCLPDMLPLICRAPKHKGLWFNFGHHHHGLTLGPVSGRLLADLVTDASPFTDPSPVQG